jgi:hypothetical protein
MTARPCDDRLLVWREHPGRPRSRGRKTTAWGNNTSKSCRRRARSPWWDRTSYQRAVALREEEPPVGAAQYHAKRNPWDRQTASFTEYTVTSGYLIQR